jgi:hypothetical protein
MSATVCESVVMSSVVVLAIAIAVVLLVLYWSGRYGGRGRAGTSLHRGPGAHTTAKGRPKKGYSDRAQAEAQANALSTRDGVAMNAYQCAQCRQWHIGHRSR